MWLVDIHGTSAAAQFSEASTKQSPIHPGLGTPVKTASTNLQTHTHSAPIAQDRNILPELGNKARAQSETRPQQGARTETGNSVSPPPWQFNTFSASRAQETGLRKTCSNQGSCLAEPHYSDLVGWGWETKGTVMTGRPKGDK